MLNILATLITSLMFHQSINHPPGPAAVDARITKLEMFFDRYQCPQPHYSYSYLQAADANSLDYRLLPAISVRESTCGQHDRLNNRWGWDFPFTGFSSVPQGIEFIAHRLAQSRIYRGLPLDDKLETYNPRRSYVRQVEHLMQEIDPTP